MSKTYENTLLWIIIHLWYCFPTKKFNYLVKKIIAISKIYQYAYIFYFKGTRCLLLPLPFSVVSISHSCRLHVGPWLVSKLGAMLQNHLVHASVKFRFKVSTYKLSSFRTWKWTQPSAINLCTNRILHSEAQTPKRKNNEQNTLLNGGGL